MPRERIIHEQHFIQRRVDFGDESVPGLYDVRLIEPGAVYSLEDGERNQWSPALEVAWNRDGNGGIEGWVQVIGYVDAGDVQQRAASIEEDETMISFPSEPLTRQQINHMIRTLRRARDAAFGLDE